MLCHACHKALDFDGKPGFRSECPSCSADAHVCKNCRFYDARAYNECRETAADRITEKEKANFCEFFQPADNAATTQAESPAEAAKRKLDALFRKRE